ncbi:MAG: hypothetical protein MI799_10095 [Desulfobacterales bacterium]|nr:hypothetical protein [Desulfobacterales bacterium]
MTPCHSVTKAFYYGWAIAVKIVPALAWAGLLLFFYPPLPLLGNPRTADSTLKKVEILIHKKAYQQVPELLNKGIKDKTFPAAERARLLLALSEFYLDQAGDTAKARGLLKKITSAPDYKHLKAFHLANIELARMDQALKTNAGLHKVYMHAKTLVMKPGAGFSEQDAKALANDYSKLKQGLDQVSVDYPVYNIHYLMGMIHLKQNRPFRADLSFGKALELRPALFLTVPVKRLKQNARYQWTRHLGHLFALGTAGGLILAMAAGFILTRPRQWVRGVHLVAGLILMAAWTGCFWGTLYAFGGAGKPREVVNKDAFFPPPAYVDFRYNAPGAMPVRHLFVHGTTLMAGIYFFSLFTARLRKPTAAVSLNLLCAILGAISVLGLFYLRHVDFKSRYYAGPNDPGYFAFRISEPEPYLLTSPLNYPVIELDAVEDPELVKWLKRYQ